MTTLTRIVRWLTLALQVVSVIAIACVFLSGNLSWMRGWAGLVWMLAVAGGVISGVLGGIFLAIANRNPLWLMVTVAALCTVYFVLALSHALGMANMH